MLKKLLAGIGIGAASVNLEIPQPRVPIGGTVSGTVKVRGGSVDQKIEQIYITLVLDSSYKHDDETRHLRQEIGTVKVSDGMLVKANSPEVSIPVQLRLPYSIPISKGRSKYYFITGLDIKSAVDPKDQDEIVVLPNTYMQMFFDAVRLLGFREKPFSGDYNGRFQAFEYRPTSFMAGKLDEIEVYLNATEFALNVVMQIDKKVRGFWGKIADDLDLDERHVGFAFNYREMQNPNKVAARIKEIIEDEYRKISF
ncbi:MAG: sporulation protein [Pelotomaculum sp.]|uniref:Sporulation control protein n=1 Tax=Pelotomaculum thermopropionicum (strain DSM 13744 / JCM 10971 / SI) TaxID=370438 RepID=A5D298_PELTS|nr:sporulation protein [Pelotomaculum sp.]BAF59641.1 sporulation control protein [Pelotomaculum thermopropionicum SI]